MDEFVAMKEKHVASGGEWRDVEPPHFYDDAAGRPRVEVHVDQFESTLIREEGQVSVRFRPPDVRHGDRVRKPTDVDARENKCEYGHKASVCKCARAVYRLGQDESIFKA